MRLTKIKDSRWPPILGIVRSGTELGVKLGDLLGALALLVATGPGFVGGSLEPRAFLLRDGGGRGNVVGSARDRKRGRSRIGMGRMRA